MKKMSLFLLTLASVLWFSCSKEPAFPPQAFFHVVDQVDSDYLLEENGGTISYSFTADGPWSVAFKGGSADWCTVNPSSGQGGRQEQVTIQVAPNTSVDLRKINVVLKATDGSSSRQVSVTQYGVKPEGSISLLAIGNSFSDDALEYLYQLLSQAGYNSIKLGNLYIGGCSLETHAKNFADEVKAYDYRVNVDGKWNTTPEYVSVEAIKGERWDYISLQQVSGFSGVPDSYEPHLTTLLEGVRALRPNAKLLWHMTWAYEQSSSHGDFAKYGKDQMTMYNAIVSAVQEKVASRDEFSMVVPSGTAIQNLRTSFIGDHLTRDGYHLSYDLGRYTAGLMWLKQITACDLADITWVPSSLSPNRLEAIKEAVDNAYAHPYEVTQSTFIEEGEELSALEQMIADAGYDPSKYELLSFDLIHPGYYNSSSDIPMTVQTNLKNYATTRIFEKSEFPEGTLIVQKTGYQYRPEGWTAMDTKNSSRPDNVSAQIVEVNEAWWGSFNFRAFNIQKTGVGDLTDILSEVKESFGIFVPRSVPSNPELEKILSDAGYDPSKYELLSFDLIHPGYYNSSSDIPMTVQTNLKNYATTRIFEKSEFPEGTLIVQKTGYQYRPEGWTAMDTKNSSRPDNVSTQIVEVNEAWWGSFHFRAFNIQKTGVGDLTDILEEVQNAFGIYVPV